MSNNDIASLIARLVPASIRDSHAYPVMDASGLLKLDAMENPHGIPTQMHDEWLRCLADVRVNDYPDPQGREVKEALYDFFDIPRSLGICLGNGSDELIQLCQFLVADTGRTVLAPTPSFVVYELAARMTRMNFVGVPLDDNFQLSADALFAAQQAHQPAISFFAYPNNPTGNCFDEQVLDSYIESCSGLVVVDEAYFGYCPDSYLKKLEQYPNLIVMRTLSKLGLAGLRLGFLMAHPAIVAEIDKIRMPYNINGLTQAGVICYLQHRQLVQQRIAEISQQRQLMIDALTPMENIRVYPSATNFLMLHVPAASAVFQRLRDEHGILIKNLHKADSPLANKLRVTVSKAADNQCFLEAFDAVMAS